MKNKKGEIATLLTLGLVLVGTLITLGSSFFVNKTKTIVSNPKAGGVFSCCTVSSIDSSCPGGSKVTIALVNQTFCPTSYARCSDYSLYGSVGNYKCVSTAVSTPIPIGGKAGVPTSAPIPSKCGTNGAYACDPALGYNTVCKDKKGLEFGCWEKSSGLFWGCIGTPCSAITGATLITESELKALQNTQGYIPQCKGGSYVAEKDCITNCGKGNCQSCKLGSYTTKYECKVSANSNLEQCGPEHFWSLSNLQLKYGKDAQCHQCLVGISVACELNGPGPTQGAFVTSTPIPVSPGSNCSRMIAGKSGLSSTQREACTTKAGGPYEVVYNDKNYWCCHSGSTGGGKAGVPTSALIGGSGAGGVAGGVVSSSNNDDQKCIDTFKTPYAYCGLRPCLKKDNVGGNQINYKSADYACKYSLGRTSYCCIRGDMTTDLTLAPTNKIKPTTIPETNNKGDDQKCKDQFGFYSYCTMGFGCLNKEVVNGKLYEYEITKYVCNINIGKDFRCCKLKDYQVESSSVTTTKEVETSNGEKGKLINIPGIGKVFINF